MNNNTSGGSNSSNNKSPSQQDSQNGDDEAESPPKKLKKSNSNSNNTTTTSGTVPRVIRIMNTCSKWLLNTMEPQLDPFHTLQKQGEEEKDSTQISPLVSEFNTTTTTNNKPSIDNNNNDNNNNNNSNANANFFYQDPQTNQDFLQLECIRKVSLTPVQAKELIDSKPFLARFTIGWIFARIIHHCIAYLEKQRRYKEAIMYHR